MFTFIALLKKKRNVALKKGNPMEFSKLFLKLIMNLLLFVKTKNNMTLPYDYILHFSLYKSYIWDTIRMKTK